MGRSGLAVLVLCIGVALDHPAAADEPRIFSREDYAVYFSPGRLQSHSPYYDSNGQLEVIRNRVLSVGGKTFLEQTVRALDVSPNYDTLSEAPFYKIRSNGVSRMVWDERRVAYLFDYSDLDFSEDTSEVFESANSRVEISGADKPRGTLHTFYRGADERAGRDVDALDRAYRADVVGAWSMQCMYVSTKDYDVACELIHLPTDRIERHLYRKLDLIG